MDIKLHEGGTVDAKEVMAYRVSTVADTGKPITWHAHGSEDDDTPAVYQNFGISYNEGQAARKTQEWIDTAAEFCDEYADANEGVRVDKHLKPSEDRPNGGIKKSELEEFGKGLVDKLIGLEHYEDEADEEVERVATKEWVDEVLPSVWDAVDSTGLSIVARPEKPKPVAAATKAISEAKQRAIDKGLSEEDIEEIFGSQE